MMSNVPKLRFQEFSGEWKKKKLGQVVQVIDSLHQTPKEYFDTGFPMIRVTDVNNGNLNLNECLKVTEEVYTEFTKKYKPQKDDIVISRVGTCGASIILKSNDKVCLGQNTVLLTDSQNQSYLFKLISSNIIQNQVNSKVVGSTQKTLSLKDLKNFSISLPSKPEQEKIALFLTSVDTKIELLVRKEELLQQYKKGVMQKIFSQEIRFKADNGSEYPEWEEKKLGEVSYITTGKSNREDSGTEGQYTFFDRSEDIRTSDIYLFDKEAIIIAGEGSDFPPKYFKGKFDLHQRTYAIMDFIDTNAKYLFSYLHFYRSYFVRYAVGSTVKSLRLPIFQNMNIKLPCLKEQTKIANFLSSIDTKIEHIQKQLNAIKAFKKALLQQMFI